MSMHVTAALRALQAVAGRPDPTDPMAVGSIARELGLSLTMVSRLCAELEELDLLERGTAYGTYRLGALAIRLSGGAAAPFAQAVRFALTLAAQQTGETVLLAAPAPEGMRVVAAVQSVWTLHSPAEVGDLIENPESAAVRAAEHTDRDDAKGRVLESTIGMSVEIAAPILGPTGECVGVLAMRLPVNRSGQNGARARRAVLAASRSIGRTLEDWLHGPGRSGDTAPETDAPTSALAAALRILLHLVAGQDTVTGAARATGLRPDRAHRLIESCRRAGFILDGTDSSRYQLNWLLHGWYRAAATPTIVERGRPLVAATANRTLTCGFITVLKSMRSFTIVEELEMAAEGLGMAPWLGRAHPIIGSDGGPALLLDFTAEELTLLFPARNTPRQLEVFLQRVRRVIRDGVLSMEAFDDAGMVSISAPVRDSSGTVIAAACLVGTTGYMREHVDEFADAARQLAASVSALLGYEARLSGA